MMARARRLLLDWLPAALLVLALSACTGQVNWTADPTNPAPSATPAPSCGPGLVAVTVAAPRGYVCAAPDASPSPTPAPAVDGVCGPNEHPIEYADNSGFYCAPGAS